MCDLCVCVNVHMRADSAVMQICAFVLLFNKNKKKEKRKKTVLLSLSISELAPLWSREAGGVLV